MWSAKYKHTDIEIHDNKITRATQTTNLSVCVLIDKQISSGLEFIIRAELCLGGIYIGVCQLNSIQARNFRYRHLGQSGHGHYLLASNGLVYSHSGSGMSNNPSFRIRTGDTITFEFKSNKLSLTKNSSVLERQQFDIVTSAESYFPCVYIRRPKDVIQLIDLQVR